MSFDFKALAQKVLDAAAEQGVSVALPEVGNLLAGLFHIGIEAAQKGETQLAKKAGTSDPMAPKA